MKNIDLEVIEFKNDCTYLSFEDELWCEAKEKWKAASEESRRAVWSEVKLFCDEAISCGELMSMQQINEMVRFECDHLFYPTSYTVEVWEYDAGTGSVGDRIEELTQTFEGLHAKEQAIGYAESLNEDYRRVLLVNDETGDTEQDW